MQELLFTFDKESKRYVTAIKKYSVSFEFFEGTDELQTFIIHFDNLSDNYHYGIMYGQLEITKQKRTKISLVLRLKEKKKKVRYDFYPYSRKMFTEFMTERITQVVDVLEES